MIGIKTSMNLLKYKLLADIVPENITVLSFKIDSANADVKVLIKNQKKYQWVEKTSDSEGVFSILVSDVPSAWFNQNAGVFYFKIFVNDTLLQIESSFEGISFEFKNVAGYETEYLIDLSTGTVTPPDSVGIGTATIGSTFIIA